MVSQSATDNNKASCAGKYIAPNKTKTEMKKIRILSIDGGGIRGIIPATILAYLENKLQEKTGDDSVRLCDYFDYMAGTSTGGILVATYLLEDPRNSGRPRFTARESLDMYLERRGCGIFNRSFSQKLTSMMGLLKEKYSAEKLSKILKGCLGERNNLQDLLKPCMITAYDIKERKPRFFKSHDCKSGKDANFKVWEVAKASASAPSYFEPAILSADGQEEVLVDGGVFANNPTLCAYTDAQEICFSQLTENDQKPNHPRQEDMLILSLGTGDSKKGYQFKEVKSKGIVSWVRPLVDILVNAGNNTVDHQIQQLFNTYRDEKRGQYYRLNPSLEEADERMDNIDPKNLQALYRAALQYIHNHQNTLDELADQLIANA